MSHCGGSALNWSDSNAHAHTFESPACEAATQLTRTHHQSQNDRLAAAAITCDREVLDAIQTIIIVNCVIA
jgi:hypothetical protein